MHIIYIEIAVVVLELLQWIARAAAVFAIAAKYVAWPLAAVDALDGSSIIANECLANAILRRLGAIQLALILLVDQLKGYLLRGAANAFAGLEVLQQSGQQWQQLEPVRQ